MRNRNVNGRRVRRLFLAACLLVSVAWPAAGARAEAGGPELKAEFISKIVRFVEWPEDAFESASDPIRVGVLGSPDFLEILGGVLSTHSVNGRSFVVEQLADLDAAGDVHIVVVTEDGRKAQRRLARALRDMPVLSIGSTFQFAEYGGTIGMELYEGRIAFDANHRAARNAGLHISSRVLKLATNVY